MVCGRPVRRRPDKPGAIRPRAVPQTWAVAFTRPGSLSRSLWRQQSSAAPAGGPRRRAARAESAWARRPHRSGSAARLRATATQHRRRAVAGTKAAQRGRVLPCSTHHTRCRQHPRPVWPARRAAARSREVASSGYFCINALRAVSKSEGLDRFNKARSRKNGGDRVRGRKLTVPSRPLAVARQRRAAQGGSLVRQPAEPGPRKVVQPIGAPGNLGPKVSER